MSATPLAGEGGGGADRGGGVISLHSTLDCLSLTHAARC